MLFSIGVFLVVAGGAPARGEDRSTNRDADPSKGTVEGVITYHVGGGRPWRYARYYVKDRKTGELAEAVVGLSGAAADVDRDKRDPATTVIDQKDFRFIPETVAIRAGDRIKFTNSDGVVHNVRVVDSDNEFNANMPAGGQRVATFNTPGGIGRPMQVGCKFHSAMRAWVYVFDHPYFQVTEADGRFRWDNVPPGKYTIEVVHPAGKLRWSKDFEVAAAKSVKLQIELSPDNVVESIRSQDSKEQPAKSSLIEEKQK